MPHLLAICFTINRSRNFHFKDNISNPLITYCEIVFQVTLIAQGDVPLSIVMTVCTTLGAVVLTPFLTKVLAGAHVPVDAIKLSVSTLQVITNLPFNYI